MLCTDISEVNLAFSYFITHLPEVISKSSQRQLTLTESVLVPEEFNQHVFGKYINRPL